MRTRHRSDEMVTAERQSVPHRTDTTNSADHVQQADPHAQVMELQRLAGNRAVSRLLGSPGSPLDPATRTQMESRFDADFAGVRLHTGPAATKSAQALNANAYTVGEDIVLHRDAFRPGTVAGQRLLAHELAHVVQQSAPGASATPVRAEHEAQRAGLTLGSSPVMASIPAGIVQMDGPRGEVSSSSSSRDGEPIRTRVRTRFVIPLLPDLSRQFLARALEKEEISRAGVDVKDGAFVYEVS